MENIVSKRVSKIARLAFLGLLAILICALPASAPGQSSLSEEKTAEYQDYIAKGQRHLEHGRFREAIAEFNRALLLDPSSDEAKKGIIKANQELAARSTAADTVSIEEDRLNFHLTKGTEYYDAEKLDEAIAEWQEALRIDPENRLAHSLIDAGKRAKVDLLIEKGHDALFAGEFDEALAIWEDAREIVPASTVLDDLIVQARDARHAKNTARIEADVKQQFYKTGEFIAKASILPEGTEPDGMKYKDVSEKPKPRKYRHFGAREAIMKELTQPVAFEFECEPLRDVLRFLTTITGINILVDEEIFERFGMFEDCYGNEVDREEIFITIHVSELPLESALNGMLRQHGLGFSIERDFIYISTPDILRGSSFEQLETRFYHLKDTSRVSMPKLDVTPGKVSLGGGARTLDIGAGKSLVSSIKEIKGKKMLELDPDIESMSFPRLVNILMTFIPTVVDQSRSEETKRKKKLNKDKRYGGLKRNQQQLKLFEAPRVIWADSSDRQILSMIEFDAHTNTLIARNTPTNLDMLEVFLDHLDPEPRQVAVEAKFITYSLAEAERVGVEVDIGGTAAVGDEIDTLHTSSGDDDVNIRLGTNLVTDILGGNLIDRGGDILFRFTKDDGDFLQATINMLSQLTNSRTISAPRLVTLHNKPAVISDVIVRTFRTDLTIKTTITPVTGDTPVTTTSITQEFTDVSEGVTLSITPQIHPDDTIRLFVLPSISKMLPAKDFTLTSTSEGETTVNTVTRPEVAIRSLYTNVVVNDGDTIVVGGLITDRTDHQVSGIPFLRDIPLIGRAFENETEVKDRMNLLIFITVNIMDSHGFAYTRLK